MRVLSELEPKNVFSFFEDICNIPHPSYKEEKISNYLVDFAKERKLGYQHVMTPCVGTVNLYKTSGHWDHYKHL